MFFKPKEKSIARREIPSTELMDFMTPLEMHYLEKPSQKEISLVSKKNYTYVDNRKITVISNSVIFIKL